MWRTVTYSNVRDSRSSNRPSGSVVRAFSSSRLWVSRKSAERTRDYTLDRSHLSLPRYTVIYQACPSHQHAQTAFGCTGNSQRLRLRVMETRNTVLKPTKPWSANSQRVQFKLRKSQDNIRRRDVRSKRLGQFQRIVGGCLHQTYTRPG